MGILGPSVFSKNSLSMYSGEVENFSESVEIRYDSHSGDELTRGHRRKIYQVNFQIGEKKIHAEFSKSVSLKNGDYVSVCGVDVAGKLDVLAFKNHTQGTLHHTSLWWVSILVGVGFILLVCNVYFFVIQSPELLDQIVMTIFTLFGFYSVYRGVLVKNAIDLLDQQG